MKLVNIGPETETIEYKKSTGEIKEAMISIVAILNKHKKGRLYFGVKNDGTVIGQTITEESLRKISRAVGNHITPAIYPEIKSVVYGDRECIQVDFEGNLQPYLAYSIPRIRVADEDLIRDFKVCKAKPIDNSYIILFKRYGKFCNGIKTYMFRV